MCKWLDISAKESDYSVDDTNDGDSDFDPEEIGKWKRESLFRDGDKGDEVETDLTVVYKLNEEEQRWVEVTDLGERVLLVGTDCSYFVSVADFDGCKRKNCVFFLDECCSLYDENFHDQYDELKHMVNRKLGFSVWRMGVLGY
ncbi:unnamed protein product [Camellia sinensis]